MKFALRKITLSYRKWGDLRMCLQMFTYRYVYARNVHAYVCMYVCMHASVCVSL